MNRIFLIFCVLLLGVLLFFKLRVPTKQQGKPAPEIEATLLNDAAFKLSDLKGKYVLLDFWGSWCPPCRRDNPNLVALYNKYNSKGFEIVSVALEKNDRNLKKAIAKDGLRWPYHIMRTSRLVATDALALKYGVTDLPTKFLLNPKGEVVGVNLSKEEISKILESS